MFLSIFLVGAFFSVSSFALPQGPNTIAPYNPNLVTQALNGSYFLVPVDKATVQQAVSYPLLDLPTDPTIFPNGFPESKHPVLVYHNYASDIRINVLEIDALLSGAIYIPWVDRLKDGKTPFQVPIFTVIGGVNGQLLSGLVPALVATLTGGQVLVPGTFAPNNAAWQSLPSGQYSIQSKLEIVPNPVSGPGVAPPFLEVVFDNAEDPFFTTKTFRAANNQPVVLVTGQCAALSVYFNDTFANPVLREGSVTLYSPPAPDGFAGVYKDVGGYTAAGQSLNRGAMDCAAAASLADPKALE